MRIDKLSWVSGLAASFVLAAVAFAPVGAADKGTGKVTHHSEKDYEAFKTGAGSPELASHIETPNITAGFARFKPGEGSLREWPYWYEEVVYVTAGKGKITVNDPPHTDPKAHSVGVGDMLHIGKGAKVTFEATGEESLEILYVTSPNPGL
jgi:mannose-6-phosphate isomerase-like protein (cupin superfamily)